MLELEPDKRRHLGLFLAFQYPIAIPGVTVANFLRQPLMQSGDQKIQRIKALLSLDIRRLLKDKMDLLQMDHTFAGRYLNEGFSGGEKKRAEVLQMAMLQPEIAIMDETDLKLISMPCASFPRE